MLIRVAITTARKRRCRIQPRTRDASSSVGSELTLLDLSDSNRSFIRPRPDGDIETGASARGSTPLRTGHDPSLR